MRRHPSTTASKHRRRRRARSAPPAASGRHLWQIQAARDLMLLAVGLLVLRFVLDYLHAWMPVLIALLLAYVAEPLVAWAARRARVSRLTAAFVLAVLTAVISGAFLAWLLPSLVEQTRLLAQRIPEYASAVAARAGLDLSRHGDWVAELLTRLRTEPSEWLSGFSQATGAALAVARRALRLAGEAALSIVVIPILFVGFSWRFDAMRRWLGELVPVSRRPRVLTVARHMDAAVAGFFRGRVVTSAIAGGLLAAGWMAAGVPYWAVLGVLSGFLNIIPYASTLGWPAAVGLKYADAVASGGPIDLTAIVLIPSAVFLGVHLLENWVLTPWIQSEQTKLSFLSITIAMLLGGAVGGILGLLLAIPVAACGKILLEDVALPSLRRWAASH